MIRNYERKDLETLLRIANDFTVVSPEWCPAELPLDKRPFKAEHIESGDNPWCFVNEVDGNIVGFIKGTCAGTSVAVTRGTIEIIVCDPVLPANQRLVWLWELMLYAGECCKAFCCTHMQGSLAANHQPIIDLFSCWGSTGENRVFFDSEFGGIVFIEPDIDTYIADCKANLL